MNASNQTDHFQDDEIDVVALAKKLWDRRKWIIKRTMVFVIIGLMVALLSPVTYTSSSMFVPNSSSEGAPSGLSGLASLAGIDLSSASGSEISPVLYPKILESASFKQRILDIQLPSSTDSISLRNYILNQPKSVSEILKKYTIGLPGTIISWFKDDPVMVNSVSNNSEILTISKSEFELFEYLDGVIKISLNEKERYVELTVTLNDPLNAAIIAKACEKLLQSEVIQMKIKQSTELLKYVEGQYEEKKAEMYAVQNRLANFKDRNFAISSASFENQQTRLQQEYQTSSAVFQEVSKQLEQVKLRVSKDTPVFSIIKPVVVPNEKSAPKRGLILVIWTILGLTFSIGYTLIKEPLKEFICLVKA
mgnify:CR=1 FL=1